MSTSLLTARVDTKLKEQFQSVCEDIGLNPSIAIKIFAKTVVNNNAIPFELKSRKVDRIIEDGIKKGLLESKAKKGRELNSDLVNEIKKRIKQ